jgi:hypothetical protein
MRLDWLRSEIGRMRQQLRAQKREIRMLQGPGVPTATAELLLMLRTRSGPCNSPFNDKYQWCAAARSPSVLPVVLSKKCSDMHAGHDTGM